MFIFRLIIQLFILIFSELIIATPDAMKIYVDGELVQVTDEVFREYEIAQLSFLKEKSGIVYLDKNKKNGSYFIYKNIYDDYGRVKEKNTYCVLNPATEKEEKLEYTSYYQYEGRRLLSKRTEYGDYTQEIEYIYWKNI